MKQKISDTYKLFCCPKPNHRQSFYYRMADYYNDPNHYEMFRLQLVMIPCMNDVYSTAKKRANVVIGQILNFYNVYNPILPEDENWADTDITDYWWIKDEK